MSKQVTINGKNFQVYDGKGLPADNDVAILVIPLKKFEREYEKDGEKKKSITYAEVGSRFAGLPLPGSDGSLAYKLTIYPVKSVSSVVNVQSI